MIVKPTNLKEGMGIIYHILNQGDNRYNSYEDELWLTDFVIHEAISLEERDIPLFKISSKEEDIIKLTSNIQWDEKVVGKNLLIKEGFRENEIYFERLFRGSRPDILAENSKRIILVECCSCRINKIIDLLIEVEEIWILTRGSPKWRSPQNKSVTMQWFVFKKGSEWSNIYKLYLKKIDEKLKNIKSPFDSL